MFGTDFCREMLLQARKKPSLAGKLVLAHSAALPFASECADAALCALSLGHIPEAAKAIAELARILRKGGRLIVTDFHPDALLHGWKRTFRSGGQSFEIETYPYTKESLIDHARRSGLVLEDLLEPCFDEPEREIFLRAGKPELFEQTRGIPAVLIARWRRP